MRKSVGKESKVDKVNTTRSRVTDGAETGQSRREGGNAAGAVFLGGANRFGLRPARFAPPKNKSQRNQERDKNPRETGHFLQYPSQNGISSSVMVLVAA